MNKIIWKLEQLKSNWNYYVSKHFQMFSGETKTDVSLKRCPGYEYMYAKGKEKVGVFLPIQSR